MGDGRKITQREKHILTNVLQASATDDPSAVIAELDAYQTQLRTFRTRLDNMETDDLRNHFHEFQEFIQTCVSVHGPAACAEAAIELTDGGRIQCCDVSMGRTDDPSYTGSYDVVVVIDYRPAISYCRIKDAVQSETDQQLATVTSLRGTLADTPEILASWLESDPQWA